MDGRKLLQTGLWRVLGRGGTAKLRARIMGLAGVLRVSRVPISKVRCQRSPFQERQGYAGRTIEHFPPYLFFQMALRDPKQAEMAFADWLRHVLIEMEAWRIPRSEGGWKDGSLCQAIEGLHADRGIQFHGLLEAPPSLVTQGIEEKVRHYFSVFESIRVRGYKRTSWPPVQIWTGGDVDYIHDGHHRVAALRALNHSDVFVQKLGRIVGGPP